MPPYCKVCNKDLAHDTSSDGSLCSVHSLEERRRSLLQELNGRIRTTADLAEIRVSPGQGHQLWVTADLSGQRVFAQAIPAQVVMKSVPYEGTFQAAVLSNQVLDAVRDAVVVAFRSGYRFVSSRYDQIELNPAIVIIAQKNEAIFTSTGQTTTLYRVDDWSKYETLGLAHDDEFYVDRLYRQWDRDIYAQNLRDRERQEHVRSAEAIRRYNDEQLHRGTRVVWSTAGPLLIFFVVVVVSLLIWLGSM